MKISNDTYEITLQAVVEKDWHIYSQYPGDGPLPTSVTFAKSPLISLQGPLKESGTLQKNRSEVFNSEIRYYENKMTLVQLIKLKGKAKTTLNGKIEFMLCSDLQCLPPETISFIIPINL